MRTLGENAQLMVASPRVIDDLALPLVLVSYLSSAIHSRWQKCSALIFENRASILAVRLRLLLSEA
jgi:hypothetical protein